MPALSLSAYEPQNGSTNDASPIAAAFEAIVAAVNGLDNTNIANAAAIAYSKLNLASSIVNADISSSAAIAASKVASVPWGFRVNGLYDLNTSTTESSLISGATASSSTGWQIPANKLGANGMVRVSLVCDYLNNSGSAANLTVKVKLGNTAIWGDLSLRAASPTRTSMKIEFLLGNYGATNTQQLMGNIFVGDNATGSVAGVGHTAGGLWAFNGSGTLDTTSAQYLDVTVLHGTSAATISFRRFYGILEYLI